MHEQKSIYKQIQFKWRRSKKKGFSALFIDRYNSISFYNLNIFYKLLLYVNDHPMKKMRFDLFLANIFQVFGQNDQLLFFKTKVSQMSRKIFDKYLPVLNIEIVLISLIMRASMFKVISSQNSVYFFCLGVGGGGIFSEYNWVLEI